MLKTKLILIITVLLSVAVIIVQPALVYASPLEDQLDNIKQEKEQTQKKIEKIEESESDLINQIGTVEEQYLKTLSELEELDGMLAEINKDIQGNTLKIEEKNRDLKEIEAILDKKVSLLNNRAASIYKYGNNNFVELLTGTKGFMEFFSKIKLMNTIAQEDIRIIQEIKEDRMKLLDIKKNIINLKEKQQGYKRDIERLLSQTEAKHQEIETIYEEKKALLQETQQDKEALLAMDRKLTAKENEIKNILRGFTHGASPTGKLLWPTNGKLSSRFGPRGGRFHSGVDIYCSRGTPIIAADSGEVIQTGYHGGYGNFILIYHGGGFATFYAHLDGFAVSGGQPVSKGQTIGYVGTTGWTTGPHLHFEVRINGIAKNPMAHF
ncbi:MAG: peptidoglycan DD-metalloendopeptidase family protein [Candidatus Humimicrobiaceae bacterium]